MKYQELRDALDAGPTPGPWSFKRHTSNLSGEHTKTDDWTIYGASGNAICFEGNAPELADPEYIAAANPDTLRALLADADKGEELKGFVQAFVMVLPLLAEAADIDLNETAIKFSANDKPLASISLQECIEKARAALSQGEQT